MSEEQKDSMVPEELDDVVKELKDRKARFALTKKIKDVVLPEGNGIITDESVPGNISACDYRSCDPPDPNDPPPDDIIGNLAACTVDSCKED